MRSPMEQTLDEEHVVVLKKCRSGLGMKICGGQNEVGSFTGIFVKKILSGGAVATEGTLEVGDVLLSANGESLLKCSNDQAVSLLRKAAQTGTTTITFARNRESRERFQRLFPDASQSLYSSVDLSPGYANNGSLSRTDSMSSRASTTSLEKRAWIYNGNRMSPAPLRETTSLSMPNLANNHELRRMQAIDLSASKESGNQEMPRQSRTEPAFKDPTIKDLLATFERTGSLDSGLPPSSRYSSPDNSVRGAAETAPSLTIEIPAQTNLGISISGGTNKPEGPHIHVKEIIQGCDADLDGRLKKGDRIVAINGESTENATYEQARSLLMRLKLRRDLTAYTVVYTPGSANISRIPDDRTRIDGKARDSLSDHLRASSINDRDMESQIGLGQDVSPKHSEGFAYHSSDDEAVLNELMKIVDEGKDGMNNYDEASQLELPYAPVKTNGDSTDPQSETTVMDARMSPNSQEMSPTHLRASRFLPGLVSSPEYRKLELSMPGAPSNQSISHYLEQDMNQFYPEEQPSRTTSRSTTYSRRSRDRRLSLDPSTRIRVEKLEAALNYLGFQATPSKIQAVRERVRVDANGTVNYGDFVDAARHVLDLRMDDRSRTLNATTLQFAMKDIEALEKAEIKKAQQREVERLAEQREAERLAQEREAERQQREAEHLADMHAMERRSQEELSKVARERDEALRELYYLRQRYNEKKQTDPAVEDELNKSRQEVANAYREVGELRTRTHLVSTALQEARQKEQQFEKKISDLEEEVKVQSAKRATGGPKQQEFNELQKRLVVLGCQLRKSEVSKRTYEVAVEKLTKFVEHVHDTCVAEEDKGSISGSRRSLKTNRSGQMPSDIAQEARDTVKSVKLLLEEEPLPFGWEEVYSPDGSRYYINHVTQTTSWLHPVSGIQHSGSKDDRQPPPLDQQF